MHRLLMDRLLRARRRLSDRHALGEGGFTMIELVVASGVLMLVLSSLAYVGTVAFADAALARNRQTATALANETLEQVRALPYATVALGMLTSDIASGADPEIVSSGGVYRFRGERIPNGNNAAITPLIPHLTMRTIDGVPYSVATYVTHMDDDITSAALRITSIVGWATAARQGVLKAVEAQTIVYTGPGNDCSSPGTHPFVAPCQPLLYANAESGQGGITVRAHTEGGTAISGIDLEEASIWLPQQTSYMQIEQVRAASATARTSGLTLRGADEETSGRTETTSASDSDPSQPKPEYDTDTVGADSSSSFSLSGGDRSITVSSGAGSTTSSAATVLATGSNACRNALMIPGALQTDSLPCGNATSQQLAASSIVVGLGSLGSATLASIAAAPTSSVAHTNYDVATQGSGASQSCPTTAGDGCIHSSLRSSVGAVRIAGLPSGLAALAPAGFDYLMRVDGFTRSVKAEAGIGNGAPSATASTSGTISYWNGLGYTTAAIGASPITLPVASVTVTSGLSSTTVELSSTVRTGSATAPACAAPCASAAATAESPLVGDLRYRVVVLGVTVVDVTIHIDLGTLLAQASYTPSPSV